MKEKDYWIETVLKIIKIELLKRKMTYRDLTEKLATIGVHETEANIKNKMSRGKFSAIFFLQCLIALGVEHLVLTDDLLK